MSDPFRPPLHPLVWEQIAQLRHKVDERHWPTITEMRVKRYYPPDEPVPPAMPQHLLNQIRWYASMLFGTEADQYEQFRSDQLYPQWLSHLSERVLKHVEESLTILESGDPGALILGYHGLSWRDIKSDLETSLEEIARQYEQGLAPSQRPQAPHASLNLRDMLTALTRAVSPPGRSDPPTPQRAEDGSGVAAQEASIGGRIRELREECLLTNEKLAVALGVDRRSVVRHISGQNRPSKKHIEAYEQLFSKKLRREIRLRNVPEGGERP